MGAPTDFAGRHRELDGDRSASGDGRTCSTRFRLRGGAEIELVDNGVRWVSGSRGRGFVAYRDLLHVALLRRSLRIASAGTVWTLPRTHFREPDAPSRLLAALRERVLSGPEGSLRLRRMERLDAVLARRTTPLTTALVMACFVMAVLQAVLPGFTEAGALRTGLAAIEPWRMLTGQMMHAVGAGWTALLSPHLLLNMLGLWSVGGLIERVLGAPRTALVAAASAAGAALASLAAAYPWVVGASGVVLGLAGALLVLELWAPDRLPAPWRLPRPLLFGALGLDLVLVSSLPSFAGAAHWGGFLAGALVTRTLAGLPEPRSLRTVRWLAAPLATVTLISWAALGWSVAAPTQAALRRAEILMARATVSPRLLNDEAWRIAIQDPEDAELLRAARRMAERAVAGTHRRSPAVLDTLAELSFQLGQQREALELIDEAILLTPADPYFREQRRRFLGERPRNDRPPAPLPPAMPPERPPTPPSSPDAVRVRWSEIGDVPSDVFVVSSQPGPHALNSIGWRVVAKTTEGTSPLAA